MKHIAGMSVLSTQKHKQTAAAKTGVMHSMHLCDRSFFYNLLMAPLHTAVSGKQGHHIPIPASRLNNLSMQAFNTSRTNAQVLFWTICKSACRVPHTQSFETEKWGQVTYHCRLIMIAHLKHWRYHVGAVASLAACSCHQASF